ncbi:uncharacterized protein N7518_008506 [Penicillium psychrosexuale]|uniref:uncharacterized protein n=1 Tax=Penicillium psychrosexuale TaxID=1002107 RepID=UPI0025454855|nr:uncharacterized protein N7518_008506 [Penicillium psychrosexuale]KAJ5791495.1 hypothetical protein N7518_008506 [Penicillium psychrosexuale]
MRDPGGKPDRPLLQSQICIVGKETAERRVWADPLSSSQPVRTDWLSAGLVDQIVAVGFQTSPSMQDLDLYF